MTTGGPRCSPFTIEVALMRTLSRADGGAGDRPLRVLFIPEVEIGPTSERTPMVLQAIRARHEVVGLRPKWDRILYNPRRAKLPRLLMYVVDKAVLTVKGLMRAREHDVGVVFCGTAHHAIPGLVIAKIRGVRCVWESHGNGRLFYESL